MEFFDSFIARYCRDSTLQARDLRPFQRVLLSTDGTVTDAIQAYFHESVGVRTLAQASVQPSAAPSALQAPADTPLLQRAVVLSGMTTGRNYVYAQSSIVTARLPAGIGAALLERIKPIGAILAEHRLETRREILVCGRRRPADHERAFAMIADLDGPTLFRTYRILYQALPVMLITEYFPEVDPVA